MHAVPAGWCCCVSVREVTNGRVSKVFLAKELGFNTLPFTFIRILGAPFPTMPRGKSIHLRSRLGEHRWNETRGDLSQSKSLNELLLTR